MAHIELTPVAGLPPDSKQNVFTSSPPGIKSTAHGNTGVGEGALHNLTTGAENTAVGLYAHHGCSTGAGNVSFGQFSSELNDSALGNTSIGDSAGASKNEGFNVFLGLKAGKEETGKNKLYIANSATATPLVYGDFGTEMVQFNTALMGFFKATPAVKPEVTGATVTAKQLAEAIATLGLLKVN
jgi:hypothetical protein